MKACKYCSNEIDGTHSVYANHVRWCDKNKNNGDKGSKKISESIRKRNEVLYPIIDHQVSCVICDNSFLLKERESKFKKRKGRYFCSYSCSKTIIFTDEMRMKSSEATKKLWQNGSYVNKFIENNVNKNYRFSSKGEEEVRKYLKENFTDDEWTSGGGYKYKGVNLTRDIYSNKLKVIVEYDGIWHFKDIHGQLDDKQMKDRLLEEWVIENDWRIVRIKDDLYRKNKKMWIDILVDSIYNKEDKIIKLFQ